MCALSGLPIRYGDKVACLLLYENILKEMGSESNRYFYAAPVFFYGKYDDYGGMEKCSGSQKKFLAACLESALLEKKSKLKIEDYFELKKEAHGDGIKLIASGIFRDYLKDPRTPNPRLFNTLILQSVLDKFLAEYTWQSYNLEKGDYDTQSYNEYLASIDEFYDICVKYYGGQKVLISNTPSHRELGHNLIGHAVRRYYEHDGGLFFRLEFIEQIRHFIADEDKKGFREFLTEFSKFAMMLRFMRDSHRAFIVNPSGHQDTSTHAQRFIAGLTIEVGRMIDQQYEE